MPSETVYFKSEQYDFLESLIEDTNGINNFSQAVQYCVRQEEQRGDVEEHRLEDAEPKNQPDDAGDIEDTL